MPFDTEWPITLSAPIGIKRPIKQNPKCEFWKGVWQTSIVHFQMLSSSHSHIHKSKQYIYYLYVLSTRCHEAIQEMMPVQIEMLSGGVEGSSWGEKKGSNDPVTLDALLQMQNGYSSGNLTKRASFDGKQYRQWPVAGSVGCLDASREAYQMTLKISSTTIKFEGGTEKGCRRSYSVCRRELVDSRGIAEARRSNYSFVVFVWNVKAVIYSSGHK